MTDQPQPLDTAAIQARVDAATEGPWYPQPDYGPDFIATELGGYEHGIGWLNFGAGSQAKANREFVTAARTDVPALLTLVENLEEELDGRDDEARERWIQKQLDQTGIRAMDFRNGAHMDLEPARDLVAHWVAAARTMLGDATNYTETRLEFDVKVAESPEMYTLVVQRHAPGALTPHEARQRAEAHAAELQQRLDAARALLPPGQGQDNSAPWISPRLLRAALDGNDASRPACDAPHPVSGQARCDKPHGHQGWHAANGRGWPNPLLPGTPA